MTVQFYLYNVLVVSNFNVCDAYVNPVNPVKAKLQLYLFFMTGLHDKNWYSILQIVKNILVLHKSSISNILMSQLLLCTCPWPYIMHTCPVIRHSSLPSQLRLNFSYHRWSDMENHHCLGNSLNIPMFWSPSLPFKILNPEIPGEHYSTWQRRFEQQDGGREDVTA